MALPLVFISDLFVLEEVTLDLKDSFAENVAADCLSELLLPSTLGSSSVQCVCIDDILYDFSAFNASEIQNGFDSHSTLAQPTRIGFECSFPFVFGGAKDRLQ